MTDLSQWQPIETAPKDETPVLAWREDWPCPLVAIWARAYDGWCLKDREDALCLSNDEAPTRWMPLPAPPGALALAGWEYATTTGPRKAWSYADDPPDERPGWELDPDRGRPGESWERFDYHEERYWRLPPPPLSL